jgi:cAMP-dependent protein kinase regulator
MYPTALFTKPILCVQDFVQTINSYATKVAQAGSPLIVYPSFTDSDIMRPFLLSKLYLQVFSGCAWSRNGPQFLAGAVDVRSTKLRQAFSAQLFFKPAPWAGSCGDKLSVGYRDALIGILSGDTERVILLPGSQAVMQSSQYGGADSASTLTAEDLAKAEKLLWALLITQDDAMCTVPTKAEAAMCLKLYRRVLSAADWQASTKGYLAGRALAVNDLNGECEEYFSLVSLMAVLSRTVVLGAAPATSLGGTRINLPISLSAQNVEPDLPGTNFQKRAAVCDLIDVSQPYVPKVFPKSAHITAILTNIVRNNILFRNYQADQHAAIVEGFEHINVSLGEVLIKQGDPGEYFYIIESGEVDIHMDSAGFKIKVGRTLTTGDYFGELALMYNTPRAATVVCTQPAVLWRMSRQTYRTIVTQHSKNTAKEFIELISNVQILGKRLGDVFSVNELNKVVSSLEVEAFEDGACIVRQYLTGDYFYIITEGQVDVYQDKSNRASIPDAATAYQDPHHSSSAPMELKDLYGKKVATLTRGHYFGEKALLADDVRQASCIAVGKVVCLSLSREDFIAMLGNWQDISEAGATSEDTATFQDVTTARPNFQLSVKLEDLETISTLGVGAFGRVKHVRHKQTGQEYALKAQAKAFIISQGMQKMLINEMNIMRTVNHSCIAKILSAMQDTKFV